MAGIRKAISKAARGIVGGYFPTFGRSLGRSVRWVVAVALLAHSAAPENGWAAGEEVAAPPTATESPPEKTGPDPIPISNIGVESERTKRRNRELVDSLAPSEELTKAKERLPEMQNQVKDQLARSARIRNPRR